MRRFFIPVLLLSLISCHYHHIEKSRQIETEGYIVFRGNLKGIEFSIDKHDKISPKNETYSTIFKYSVRPGVHVLQIYKNGSLIKSEKFYIGSQETKEVNVQ